MTSSFDFELLSTLGLTRVLAARAIEAAAASPTPLALVRITEVHRETLIVHDGHASVSARPLPHLLRALHDEGTSLAVGDWGLMRDRRRTGQVAAVSRAARHAHRPPRRRWPSPRRRQQRRHRAARDGAGCRLQSAPARALSRPRARGRHHARRGADQARHRGAYPGCARGAPGRASRPHLAVRSTSWPWTARMPRPPRRSRPTSARADARAARLVGRRQVHAHEHAARRDSPGHRRSRARAMAAASTRPPRARCTVLPAAPA